MYKDEDLFEASYSQERFYYVSKMAESTAPFHISSVIQFNDEINFEIFQKSYRLFCLKHEALSTVFVEKAGKIYQTLVDDVPTDIELLKREHITETELKATIDALTSKSFDLAKAPLFRGLFIQTNTKSYFIFTIHHIIVDGVSMGIFLNDLQEGYSKLLVDSDYPGKEADFHYIDYSEWQKEFLNPENMGKLKDFWKNYLDAPPEKINLPLDHNRPPTFTYEGEKKSLVLTKDFEEQVRPFYQRQGISPFQYFFYTLSIFLNFLSSDDDIVIGLPIANRNNEEFFKIFGCFINLLPVRFKFDENLTISNLFSEFNRQYLAAQEHGEFPFDKIVEAVQPNRSLSYAPLFQVLFGFQDDTPEMEGGLDFEVLDLDSPHTQYDLFFMVENDKGQFQIKLDAYRATFSNESIQLFLEMYAHFCHEVANPENQTLKDLAHAVAKRLDDQHLSYCKGAPAQQNVVFYNTLKETAKTQSSRIALVDAKQSYDYQELWQKITAVAHFLKAKGVVPGERVACLLDHSADSVALMLGVMLSRAVYVPIDPNAPTPRKQFMIEDCQARLLIRNSLSDAFETHVDSVEGQETLGTETDEEWHDFPQSDDLAYMIYTSGTSGKPKGVLLKHKNIGAYLENIVQVDGLLRSNLKSMLFSSFAFDVSIHEIFSTLFLAGTLYPRKKEFTYDFQQLVDYIEEHQISHVYVPTGYLFHFTDYLVEHNISLPHCIEVLSTAGEALPLETISKVKLIGKDDLRFFNGYGPTEATILATVEEIVLSEELERVPIGKPLPSLSTAAIRANGTLCPRGIPGELVVFGNQVATGYHNREELTQERFNTPGTQLFDSQNSYRTGDLVRLTWDDKYEYLGRIDNQIKIRGYRVELGEINTILESHDNIELANTLVTEDSNGMSCLIAYLIKGNQAISLDALRSWLKEQLPDYSIPSSFVLVEKFPINTSGKVDQAKLLSMGRVLEQERTIVTAKTDTEIKLAQLWGKILAMAPESIDLNASFFELGGHSLNALRLFNSIREEFEIDISPSKLYALTTIAQQVKEIEKRGVAHLIKTPLSTDQQKTLILEELQETQDLPILKGMITFPKGVYWSDEKKEQLVEALHSILPMNSSIAEGHVYHDLQWSGDIIVSNESILGNLDEHSDERFSTKQLSELIVFVDPNNVLQGIVLKGHPIVFNSWNIQSILEQLSSVLENSAVEHEPRKLSRSIPKSASHENDFSDNFKPLSLPFDHAIPALWNPTAISAQKRLETEEFHALQNYCLKNDVSKDALLLSVYAAVMQKFSGQKDFVLGYQYPQPEGEPVVVPITSGGNPSQKVHEIASDIEGQLNTLQAFEGSSLDQQANLPVVQAIMKSPVEVFHPNFQSATAPCFFHLEMESYFYESSCELRFSGSVDLFHQQSLDTMAQLYLELLKLVISNSIDAFGSNLLAEEPQLRSLASILEGKKKSIDCHHGILGRLEHNLNGLDSKVALQTSEKSFSYEELHSYSNKIVSHLFASGRAGEPVGLFFPRNEHLVSSLISCLRAGNPYVPLDKSLPKDRLKYIVAHAKPNVILTCRALGAQARETFGEQGQQLVMVEDLLAKEHAPLSSIPEVSPDSAAYLMYTSGTTGNPKGIVVPHKAIANTLVSMGEELALTESDVLPSLASFGFDISVAEILLPLIHGGKLVVPHEDQMNDHKRLLEFLISSKVTKAQAVPALWRLLLDAGFAGEFAVISGADVLTSHLADELIEQSGCVHHYYGPTETAIWSSFSRLTQKGRVDVGTPMTNEAIYLLDSDLSVVPKGAIGEIFIGGNCLSYGYHNETALTEQCFVANPFASESGALMYKTGDLARMLPNGKLDLLGRSDFQVKIRGFRIELQDVESHINKFRESAVVAVKNGESAYLAAFIVTDGVEGFEALRAEIVEGLNQSLPPYMVPTLYVPVDKLPLNSSQKVDRKKLLQNLSAGNLAKREVVAPETPLEKQLLTFWQEVLPVKNFGVTDSFFELGGHSLLATQMIAKIQSSFSKKVMLKEFYAHNTIQAMAKVLENKKTEGMDKIVAIPQAPHYELSYSQKRLWFLDKIIPIKSAYNMEAMFHVKGNVDIERFKNALEKVAMRHETLRTYFVEHEDGAYQKILEEPKLDFSKIRVPSEMPEAELLEMVQKEAEVPYDLYSAPLFRCRIFQRTENQYVLLLSIHHIISDGWSMGVLASEIMAHYNIETLALPELPFQFKDYADWQSKYLLSGQMESQLSFWKETLRDAPEISTFPSDFAKPTTKSYVGNSKLYQLPKALSQSVNEFCRHNQITPYILFKAALATLISLKSDQNDIVLGTLIANRNTADVEKIIGFFVNTVVSRIQFEPVHSFRDLLEQIQESFMEVHENQDLPFEHLIDALDIKRNLSYSPIFQIMFIMQNTPQTEFQLDDIELSMIDSQSQESKFDMIFAAVGSGDGFDLNVEYDSDLFREETIDLIVEQWMTLTNEIVCRPDQAISAQSLLNDHEKAQVLHGFNQTDKDFGTPRRVCDLISEVAAEQSEKTAVLFGDVSLSYNDLEEQSNQMARFLVHRGIEKDDIVAVHMERSHQLVVTLLGIIKAGAAYMPIDTALPDARKKYMCDNSSAKFVIFDAINSEQEFTNVAVLYEELVNHNLTPPLPRHKEEGLCYLIYTSGSTGLPKGVRCSHFGLFNRLLWMKEHYQLGEADVFMQKTPYSFDVSVWEFFLPFLCGGKLVVLEPKAHLDPTKIAHTINEHHVSNIHFVPSMLREFLESRHAQSCESLKRVFCSGEELPADSIGLFFSQFGDKATELHNLYGPTEAAIDVTYWEVQKDYTPNITPIGKPVSNVQMYILDENLEAVAQGISGELFIGGVQNAFGYINDPIRTSQSFIADPFADEAGQRLYRTGDYGRWNSLGEIEYLGRMDSLVKLNGLRIELGEIENRLVEFPSVAKAVVLVKPSSSGTSQLHAYLLAKDSEIDFSSLKVFLQKSLPSYMVPNYFKQIEQIPTSKNGKVDRGALAAIPAETVAETKIFNPPVTELQKSIFEVWSTLLGHRDFGIQSNFFDLGGNSLMAITLCNKLSKQLNCDIEVKLIFDAPTIEMLGAVLQDSMGTESKLQSSLMKLREPSEDHRKVDADGNEATVLFVPGVDGFPFVFHELAADFAAKGYTVYSFIAPGQQGEQKIPQTIEALAEKYLTDIQHDLLNKKFHLVGYSFGGTVAYEMVSKLEKHNVASSLTMIDAIFPSDVDEPTTDMVLTHFFTNMGRVMELSGEELESKIFDLIEGFTSKDETEIAQKIERIRNLMVDLLGENKMMVEYEQMMGMYRIFEANLVALYRYQPQPIEMPIQMLLPEENPERSTESWNNYTSVETTQTSGNHYTMLRGPHKGAMVQNLIQHFEKYK